jgi:hypothetical protein
MSAHETEFSILRKLVRQIALVDDIQAWYHLYFNRTEYK